MGTVYEAVQLDLERTVAIKVLPREVAGDEKANARLRQEAMAAARLGHPNVVEIFELGMAEDGSPFIVMERLVGTSLKGVIVEQRRLSLERAVHIALQMLDALGAAHAAGIVHRDVKPANVMVLEDDRVKLVDFGIARFSEDERSVRTTTGTLLGTPAYLAPEQLDARGVDARTDLHAVGLCLFEMLLGARPWRGAIPDVTAAVMRTIPPRVDTRREDVPKALADVIERALAKDPNARFASANAMSGALRASVSTRAPIPVAVPPKRPVRLVALGITVGMALASLATALLLVRKAPNASAPQPSSSPPQSPNVEVTAEPDAPPALPAPAPELSAAIDAAPPARHAGPAGALDEVLCNDPTEKYGYLCASPHPDCYCGRGHTAWSTDACGVPFVNGRCPAQGRSAIQPSTSKHGGPCTLYFLHEGKESTETGVVTCQYCNMSQWHNEPKRWGVVGAPCTGINFRGETTPGRYLRHLK